MNLSNNYPLGVSELTINQQFGNTFTEWFEKNEDWLLDKFIDYYQDAVIIPAVKDWGPAILKLWNNFVQEEWDNY